VSAEFDLDAVPAEPLAYSAHADGLEDLELDPDAADRPIRTPLDDAEHLAYVEAMRRAYARHELRLSRMRLYSYCMTLSACVFALMTFMYVTQGEADRDGTFIGLGTLFGAMTIALLWGAVRVTRVGETPFQH
jgi:hypothetical protein